MNIYVDRDLCELHGNCVASAPELFRFNQSGELEYEAYADGEQIDAARDAQAGCPMFAIEVKEGQ